MLDRSAPFVAVFANLQDFPLESIQRSPEAPAFDSKLSAKTYPSSSRPSAFRRESRDPSTPAIRSNSAHATVARRDTWVPDRLAKGEPSGMTNFGSIAYRVKTSGKPSRAFFSAGEPTCRWRETLRPQPIVHAIRWR